MASDDESDELWPPPQSIAAQVGLPDEPQVDMYRHPNVPLTPDQELRMRCVEAASRAVSGCTFMVQGETVKQIADVLERYVKGG